MTSEIARPREGINQGDPVRVTIEMPDGRTIVTDGTFWEAAWDRDVHQVPGTGPQMQYEAGEMWFTLTLRGVTSTQRRSIKP